MINSNDYHTDDSNIIYIDGTEEGLIPGLNDVMARMAELYIDNFMDQDYLDGLDEDEWIVIDYTALSDEEMSELIKCAVTSLKLDADEERSGLLLS